MSANAQPLAPALAKLARHHSFSAAEAEAFLSLPHEVASVRPGKFLVREGEAPTKCCALLSGWAYRHKSTGDGARQILSIHLPGDLVDLQNSMLARADHSVQTLTSARVALIVRSALLDLAVSFPTISRALLLDSVIDGSISREWLLNLGKRDARGRLAHLLCELAVRQDETERVDSVSYHLPMTQEQLADVTGLTSVHVNRTLRALRDDGLIAQHGRTLTILDWPGLQRDGDFTAGYLHRPPIRKVATA